MKDAQNVRFIVSTYLSSKKQQSSLHKQKELLIKRYPDGVFISDVASGFNQNRRGYKTILARAIDGTPLHVVATTSDRVSRTGFQLIKWIIELSGGRVELLEEPDTTDQFATTTLIAYITSFINSDYGKRNGNRNKQENKDLSRR
jgi:predicted site-specific integrase-resolvase